MTTANSRTWIWRYDRPVRSIWPVLADTARFNEAARLPKHAIDEIAQADGSVLYLAHANVGPYGLRWREQPVNWVDQQWFEHCRHFENGPFLRLCAHLEMFPEGAGCRAEYTVDVAPRNWLGRALLATVFFGQVERTFTPLADNARSFARGETETEFVCRAPQLAPGGRARAARLVEAIEASGRGHGLAQRLADFVLSRQEVDVWAIRPLKLARMWHSPERHAIEVCLEATKQGLLRLRWDLLCPRCQVAKASVPRLDALPRGTHCATCNIDYERDYTNNIELTFQPAAVIRPLESGEYCLFGPMSTPHIKLQITLAPGQAQVIPIKLTHGHYRVRTLEPGAEVSFEWSEGHFPAAVIDDVQTTITGSSALDCVALRNASSRQLTFIVEERIWRRDALTAQRATALQAFRDLFTDDVLRPGDDVEIDHITIMFTDLKGSTALYEKIGDPQAYHLVREHFALLGKAVREHDGAIVKTIGDAIMAVFNNPEDALRSALQIHGDFERFNATRDKEPLTIKLGLHLGRCISVTLNDRLDYYGSVANKAARVQGQSTGGDIVMSLEYAADPLVARLLDAFEPCEETARLKGFDQPVKLLRLSAEQLAKKRIQTSGLPILERDRDGRTLKAEAPRPATD